MDSNQQSSSLFQLNLDAQNSFMLRSMASWSKIFGILSIIFAIMIAAWGVFFQQKISSGGIEADYRGSGLTPGTLGNMTLVVYIVVALVYLISGLFAYNAGNKINLGLRTNTQDNLSRGFANARNFFALWTILLIISLLILLLGLFGMSQV